MHPIERISTYKFLSAMTKKEKAPMHMLAHHMLQTSNACITLNEFTYLNWPTLFRKQIIYYKNKDD